MSLSLPPFPPTVTNTACVQTTHQSNQTTGTQSKISSLLSQGFFLGIFEGTFGNESASDALLPRQRRRLEEEVSGMEEELSGMYRPLSAVSLP